MTFADLAIIGLGGGIGTLIRYSLALKWNATGFLPIGTLFVNWSGSFLIGFKAMLNLNSLWTYFIISGIAGGMTTFSTLNKELVILWKDGKRKIFFFYLIGTYSIGIFFAYLGIVAGRLLAP